MALNYTDILNPANMLEAQCKTYCLQEMVDKQYSAMVDIYNKFNGYLLSIIAFFIVYAFLEAFVKASENGYWRINYGFGKKDIPFNPDVQIVKTVKYIKGLLYSIMFALALVYYFVYGHLATLGY